MKFDDFDQKMRAFELSLDRFIESNVYIVARLDGRGFTKLTKEILDFERPFDLRFHEAMCSTVLHLMDCGFRIDFGYTQSDEISLLFALEDNTFSRKTRKINSVLAGEASAAFSLTNNHPGVFDCRICPLPNTDDVVDYFRWRQADAERNALSAYCYWVLRDAGLEPEKADQKVNGWNRQKKETWLSEQGVNFSQVPHWQRYGACFHWLKYTAQGFDPIQKTAVQFQRRRLEQMETVPVGATFGDFILAEFLNS